MPKTTWKSTKTSAVTQLAQCDVDDECPLLVSRWDRTDNGKTPFLDIDTDDADYEPDVKHILSYPNNPKAKKKYVKPKAASKPSATSGHQRQLQQVKASVQLSKQLH
eukprot:12119370-Ditylum_brightwellii.AAC.1